MVTDVQHAMRVPATDLPDHLKFRQPAATNPFPQVSSRYLQSSPTRATRQASGGFPQLNTDGRFSGVSARYMSPKKEVVRPRPDLLGPKDSVRVTKEYAEHKRIASHAGFGGANSRYRDIRVDPPPPPPEKTAEQRELDRAEKRFRGAWSTQGRTFSDIAKTNDRSEEWRTSPLRGRSHAPSKVMDHIRNGTPLRTGRSTSPTRIAPEPRMGGVPYRPAGGAGGGRFDRRDESPVKTSVRSEQSRVVELQVAMERAPRSHTPPRVATASTVVHSKKAVVPTAKVGGVVCVARRSPSRTPGVQSRSSTPRSTATTGGRYQRSRTPVGGINSSARPLQQRSTTPGGGKSQRYMHLGGAQGEERSAHLPMSAVVDDDDDESPPPPAMAFRQPIS